MTVSVEVHPWTRMGLPKRWRVMCDGKQHSVHETTAEAEAAAKSFRQRAAGGSTASILPAKSPSKARSSRRR